MGPASPTGATSPTALQAALRSPHRGGAGDAGSGRWHSSLQLVLLALLVLMFGSQQVSTSKLQGILRSRGQSRWGLGVNGSDAGGNASSPSLLAVASSQLHQLLAGRRREEGDNGDDDSDRDDDGSITVVEVGASPTALPPPAAAAAPAATTAAAAPLAAVEPGVDPQIADDLAPWAAVGGWGLADVVAVLRNATAGAADGAAAARRLQQPTTAQAQPPLPPRHAPASSPTAATDGGTASSGWAAGAWPGVAPGAPFAAAHERGLALYEFWVVDGVLYYDSRDVADWMGGLHSFPVLFKLSGFLNLVRESLSYHLAATQAAAAAAAADAAAAVAAATAAAAAAAAAAAVAQSPAQAAATLVTVAKPSAAANATGRLDGADTAAGGTGGPIPAAREDAAPQPPSAPAGGNGTGGSDGTSGALAADDGSDDAGDEGEEGEMGALDARRRRLLAVSGAKRRRPNYPTGASPPSTWPDVYGLVNVDPLPVLPGKPAALVAAPWPPPPAPGTAPSPRPARRGRRGGKRPPRARRLRARSRRRRGRGGGSSGSGQGNGGLGDALAALSTLDALRAAPSPATTPLPRPLVPPAPVLSLCKTDAHWDVLYPNMYFVSPQWWAVETARLREAADRNRWRRRGTRVWWRGTAGHEWPANAPRIKALSAWGRRKWADMAFVDNFTRTLAKWEAAVAGSTTAAPGSIPAAAAAAVVNSSAAVSDALQARGVPHTAWRIRSGPAHAMDIAGAARNRYALHLPGFFAGTYSRSLQFLLWTRTTVFMLESPYYEFYYRHLVPWTHYVPVVLPANYTTVTRDGVDKGAGPGTLDGRYRDVSRRRDGGRSLGLAGGDLAAVRLSPAAIARYWAQLITAYARLQRYAVVRRDATSGAPLNPAAAAAAGAAAGSAAAAVDGRRLCTCWPVANRSALVPLLADDAVRHAHLLRTATRAQQQQQQQSAAADGDGDGDAAELEGPAGAALLPAPPVPRLPSLPLMPFDAPAAAHGGAGAASDPPAWVTVPNAQHCGAICRPYELARLPAYRSWSKR
jgi:hypothetical protein